MLAPAFAVPPPISWRTVLADWTPDLTVVLVAAAAGAYVVGVHRLAGRGRRWPVGRSVSFAAGLVVLLVALNSGLAAYDRVLFSVHVVQHIALGMAAPLLLALGAPITLALQAGGRTTQRRLLAALHSRPVRVVTHPLVAWVLFGASLVVLYFTGLYELSLRHEAVHVLVHTHFLLVGCIFCWHIVAVDPIPNALGYGARVLFVAILIPFHAFLGVALLGAGDVLASDWYQAIGRTWGSSPLDDQRTGAGVLWLAGELFGVLAIGIAAARWMAHEERAATRADRALDQAATTA